MSTAHEIGHFLDHAALGEGEVYGSDREALAEWRQAVRSSQAMRRLREMSATDFIEVSFQEATYRYQVDQDYVQYLMRERECFARSYAQYIATKSKNKSMLAELAEIRGEKGDMLHYPNQWDDEDFVPILNALDSLFKKRGWIR